MRWGVSGGLLGLVLLGIVPSALAQEVGELFARINPSVVVIRAKGRDVTARGVGQFTETGSGVLMSADGHVMTAAARRPVRCAIYTRVSTDSGLDQDFNSLDAQREAAEAFEKARKFGPATVSRASEIRLNNLSLVPDR
jgi:hypothetical protein